jgi:hypothetical protein
MPQLVDRVAAPNVTMGICVQCGSIVAVDEVVARQRRRRMLAIAGAVVTVGIAIIGIAAVLLYIHRTYGSYVPVLRPTLNTGPWHERPKRH